MLSRWKRFAVLGIAAAAIGYICIPQVVEAGSSGAIQALGENGYPTSVGMTGDRLKVEATAPDGGLSANAYLQAPDGGSVRAKGTAEGYPKISVSADLGAAFGEALCSSSTPTLIGGLSGRRSIALQNLGPNPVYVCTASAGCTTGTGIRLSNGDPPLALDVRDTIPVYCIAATSTQLTGAGTRYLEVR